MAKPVPVFAGVVTAEGKLILDARTLFAGYVKTLANKPVQLVLKRLVRPKSHSQLGYLWGVIYPVIAEELGYMDYEVDALHDAIVRELCGLKPDPNPLKLRVSLAEMDHEQVSEYIESVRHWAVTNYGIVTPDAEKAEPVPTRRKRAA